METNELMTGDLLRVNNTGLCIKEGTIVRVYAIDGENSFPQIRLKGSATVKPIGQEDEISGGIWLAYLEPIPLTSEILEKNGFINGEFYAELQVVEGTSEFRVRCDTRQLGIRRNDGFCSLDIPCHYFHELQHAFRLCGIKKELTI